MAIISLVIDADSEAVDMFCDLGDIRSACGITERILSILEHVNQFGGKINLNFLKGSPIVC